MKTIHYIIALLVFFNLSSFTLHDDPPASGYAVGSMAKDFKLKNVDGKNVSLSDYKTAKGFIVVFTCNHCPYAQAYEQRIIELHKKYNVAGYPVIAINPNDKDREPADSYENMQ